MKSFSFIFLLVAIIFFSSCDFFSKHDSDKKDSLKVFNKNVDTNNIKVIVGTLFGNEKRNYYGDEAPSHLNVQWKFDLGTGQTRIKKKLEKWSGAGWTGQPLIFLEDSVPYIIQGAYDHFLRRINALTGKEIWAYEYDDIIKSTGTIWINKNAKTYEEKYVVMQGSRAGVVLPFWEKVIPSYRAVSLITGKELWKLNSWLTEAYSRDVDGSSLIINDTAYIGLENGFLVVFNPDNRSASEKDEIVQPQVYQELCLFDEKDKALHGGDLLAESSPARLGDHVYITAGSGHVYGYNLKTKKIDWDYFTGSDINGSPNVTNDSCLIIPIEKQYILGLGGMLKLDPSKPPEQAALWYFPVEDKKVAEWLGGIIGSASINDFYNKDGKYPDMAACIATDGFLYVVNHKKIKQDEQVLGFDNVQKFNTPELIFKYEVGPAISTPVIVKNKLIACTYTGMWLFEFDTKGNFKLLDHKYTNCIESTPVVYNKRIYVACRDGFLYCYGDDSIADPPTYYSKVERKYYPEDSIPSEDLDTSINVLSEVKQKFYLVAGSFEIKSNAESLSSQLQVKGCSVQIMAGNTGKFLVCVGVLNSKEDALKTQAVLNEKGVYTWIYQ